MMQYQIYSLKHGIVFLDPPNLGLDTESSFLALIWGY